MPIRFFSDDVPFKMTDKRATAQWLKQVAQAEGRQAGDLNYVFVSEPAILQLNRQFLGHDYFTDIITFDNSEGSIVAGEMYISSDTVASNAKQYGVGFDEELRRVIVHGLLHLCGYNDHTAEEQEEMRKTETKYLCIYHNKYLNKIQK